MVSWYVELEIERDSNFDPPTQEEWDRLFPIVGEVVKWSGEGPPTEFSSSVEVEADDQEDASSKGVDLVWERLASEGLHGWMISSDTARRKEEPTGT